MVNTIFVFTMENIVTFFVKDGDYSQYHGVFINSGEKPELEDQLFEGLFDDDGNFKLHPLDSFPKKFYTENTKVVVCGEKL